ncbi:ABC transporter permease subunit [Fictibacillus nanhaiensis]|uniref:ABC transporter permease subunit n=1 Tax=Fictibacillus nanhaiensis TaxID=742169 RepID=UPI002E242809|nr:ABC transporter permease subunit [Fictibacillus nanhaiensis]MED1866021.1 ABC transporter permease subunit [Fictibacillus nanhaiensis]
MQEKVWVYTMYTQQGSPMNRDVFPEIFNKFFYSMTIFFVALVVGLMVALVLTFSTTMLPKAFQRFIQSFLSFLESFPDLFIVVVLQVLFVYIYKKTGILLYFYNDYDNPIYILPILVLSIVPTIQLFKLSLLLMKEEQDRLYVTVARSMGLSKFYILLKHVFRNILTSLLQYSKTIFVFMLSNLFIVEYVYNLNGIMHVLLYMKGLVFLVTALIIALPFSVLFEISDNYNANVRQRIQKEAA